MGKWPTKMRVHSADQNTNDDRDLARKRQSKKLFLSHKTLGCLNPLTCTYTVTVIQASYQPHGIFYIFHIYIFCWIWTLWRMEDVSVEVVRSMYYFTALMIFWEDILGDGNFQNKTFAKAWEYYDQASAVSRLFFSLLVVSTIVLAQPLLANKLIHVLIGCENMRPSCFMCKQHPVHCVHFLGPCWTITE